MNRSEILFLYDIADANPNGDPLDGNKPRLDEETEINIVTDVRLKRTIRDYLNDYKNQGIFIKEIHDDDGNIQDAKQRALDYASSDEYESLDAARSDLKNNILDECIDVRLFGATIPIDVKVKGKKKGTSSSVTLTGPVQFRMGRSLNKVEIQHIKGTGAFASGKGKEQKTFREEYVLPYSLIAFYGIVNENAAKETKLKPDDVDLLLDGIWNGTKNLISRSKFGQSPRCLIQIEYNEDNFFIGDLNNKISISHDLEDDKKLRKISEITVDLSNLINSIEENKGKINKINYKFDSDIRFKDYSIDSLINKFNELGIDVSEISF
ncbi:type I-B CRISPR-associated protein Cas7/Csh2 [uncultured Methanobrevibacter sp.]|uniref:type I-B CRISPR-associated protein Cas7/Csh2 n=1 Tax=uncultured Methanobrevibacter sp. TaxID=253161 RepID=UPI0025E7218B|nr:type I-B CRISPR-associated protein Cas7/Csh2 [uncultured Methanobrevibacter sp.]